jgi:putative intracellular protease/amidase
LAAIRAENFAGIFIPGGHGVMFDLADDASAAKLIQEFDTQEKPIAAVCHGPAALVKVFRKDGTPLVKGKTVAAFTDDEEREVKLDKDMPFLLETKLRELGARIDKKEKFAIHAVRDGNLITGQNPASSEATVKLFIEAVK